MIQINGKMARVYPPGCTCDARLLIHCIVGEIFFNILNASPGIKTRRRSGEPTKYYTLRQMKVIGHFLTTSVDSTRDRCDFSMITKCWPE